MKTIKSLDLTRRKFGRLTVIERVFPNAKSGSARCLCKCICGSEVIVQEVNLKSGNTESCGCLHKEIIRLRSGLASMRARMSIYKQDAKRRNLKFELTEKQFGEITKQDCYYCGSKPNNVTGRGRPAGSYTYNGLDRVDNSKGYMIDNIVPCCDMCNGAKSNYSLQEFQDWNERVYNKFKGKLK